MAFDIHIPGPVIPLIPEALCIGTGQNSGTALQHMLTVIVAAVGNELQMELHVVFPVLQCRKLICPIPAAFLHGELLQFRNIFRGKRRSINPEAALTASTIARISSIAGASSPGVPTVRIRMCFAKSL